MDIKKYKAGHFTSQFGYKSFIPESINKEWLVSNPDITSLLEEANLCIGKLNGISIALPEIDVFMRMHIVKEATQSSRIEGTKTEMDEAVLAKKDIATEKVNDWQEVQNYMEAMRFSIKKLKKLPISSRLLKEAHKILLKGVRGTSKMPGEFRKSQNWIGGATLKDAVFVPPHATLVNGLMSDLEKFLNKNETSVPQLVKIGMAHYQFEAIHPFLDGNGRIGRLMITLYLVSQKILDKPVLYLSDFIEKNRAHYYANLISVSQHNTMEQWLKFFLTGVIETSKNATNTLHKILKLRQVTEGKTIMKMGKRIPMAKLLLNYLYVKPVVTVTDIQKHLKVTKQTANTLLNDFEKLGILKEKTGFKRNRIFIFEDYINLFK